MSVSVPNVRIAALDLDGTLLRSDGTLSPRTADTLARAREAGLEPVVVTARHLAGVLDIRGAEHLSGHAICCSGAAVYDLPSRRLVEAQWLSGETVATLLRELRTEVPEASYGWVDQERLVCTADFPGALPHEIRTEHEVMTPSSRILKAFALDPQRREFSDVARRIVGHRAAIGHHSARFAELLAPRASKVAALRRFCAERGVTTEQVVAFGDAAGDIPMLRWAGHGVAMANAPEAVRRAADAVTDSCDADGVARVIERILR